MLTLSEEFVKEQDRLEDLLRVAGQGTLRGLMIRYAMLDNLKLESQKFLDRYKEQIEDLEQQLVDALIAEGHQNVKSSDTGRTFFRRTETFYNVPADKKQDLIALFDRVGEDGQPLYPQFASMVKRDYNTNSFRSVCRETIEQDGELPSEFASLVKVSTAIKLGVRK
ncbi:hypothetical protein LBMAG46_42950 [Planctomycetia bacterium]|nr:hypothetical protein LBMAG46_42950 [Planctomycetia bacterium]